VRKQPAVPPAPGPCLTEGFRPLVRIGKGFADAMALAGSLGLQFAISAGLGLLAGSWLDRRLGWSPVMMIVLGLFGAGTGFYLIVKTVLRQERNRDKERR